MDAKKLIEDWVRGLPRLTRGDIAGGLVLLEHLRKNFALDINAHKASGSDQLKGATPAAVGAVLERFGEKRMLSKEAGRTNRGLMTNLSALLSLLAEYGADTLAKKQRDVALMTMQEILAAKATAMLNAKKLTFDYKPGMTSHMVIAALLEQATKHRKRGDVAEYLVGAKLALRFPKVSIRNASASAADEQAGEHGDFQIHDSVFHITVSPNVGHYQKCANNLANGLRVFLLVPDNVLAHARECVQGNEAITGRIAVESIESFVSQNIEELSEFSSEKITAGMADLLCVYNERVDKAEVNKSLLIEIPAALRGNS